jgi:hypothetical protein
MVPFSKAVRYRSMAACQARAWDLLSFPPRPVLVCRVRERADEPFVLRPARDRAVPEPECPRIRAARAAA